MDKKFITMAHEGLKECPECKGDLKLNKEWDEWFDRYADRLPSFDFVVKRLCKEEIPKYICKDCNVQILMN